ncbi:MAG: hypothetical protein VYC21_02085 [Bacteroidota bacterium]|nr:hypothetical protein [Flavobacteriaceae bacterium]MEC7869737.1 hypothetical protein [Bacteroidota bacterium]MEC8615699.1 hypothetical protein [Bacteroidota bacterium]|tara:strand:+ start:279 stop:539 length:261 start_codon:yes stop_codon:yes gene_type:complete
MKISVELTLAPLDNEYKVIIRDFIISLRKTGYNVIETPLSTQIYGDFLPLMNDLTKVIENTFLNSNSIILNIKIIKGDRSDYRPNF